jgi:hypothetical protein
VDDIAGANDSGVAVGGGGGAAGVVDEVSDDVSTGGGAGIAGRTGGAYGAGAGGVLAARSLIRTTFNPELVPGRRRPELLSSSSLAISPA